jgi:hypothetical protein
MLLGALATALVVGGAILAVLLLPRWQWPGHDAATDDEPTELALPAAAEIDQQAQALRERAAAIEGELHATDHSRWPDPLTARIWSLSMQASALEREVTSNPGSLPGYSITHPGSANSTHPLKGDDQ